jgi:hypothetical protein
MPSNILLNNNIVEQVPEFMYVGYLTRPHSKIKLSLCLTKHHAMKNYWGVEV